jgi:hypothetical protein
MVDGDDPSPTIFSLSVVDHTKTFSFLRPSNATDSTETSDMVHGG